MHKHLGIVSIAVGIIVLFIINLSFASEANTHDAVSQVLRRPNDPAIHSTLARLFWINGMAGSARTENTIAEELSGIARGPSVLSATVPDRISTWQRQSFERISGFVYWKTLAIAKPDYLSAHIMTAYYALMTGKIEDAKKYYQTAYSMDPTNVHVVLLKPFIF